MSKLINQFRRRTFRHLPRPVRPPGLETQLELRPARFALGLGERVKWHALKEAEDAPVNGAYYLGRVEEVVGDEVLATLWERPSGREASTTLSVKEQLRGEAPAPGSLLRIWTWVELPGNGEQRPRLKVEVERVQLDESERSELLALARSLEEPERVLLTLDELPEKESGAQVPAERTDEA